MNSDAVLGFSGRGAPAAATQLRRAEAHDAAAIVALSAGAVAAGTLVARDEAAIRSAIDEFVLVEAEGVVSAVVGLGRRDEDLLIYNFCVGEALRGRGVGTHLVERAVIRAMAEDCRAVIAFAPAGDGWFPRQGFRRRDDRDLDLSRARLRTPGRRSALFERLVGASSLAPC